jgi:hypothetical protein
MDPRIRGRTATVVSLMREALLKDHGISEDDQVEYIATHMTDARWANAVGNLPKTITNLERNWFTVMFGADAERGRSNGTTTEVRNRLYQTANVHHRESFSQLAARKGHRDD